VAVAWGSGVASLFAGADGWLAGPFLRIRRSVGLAAGSYCGVCLSRSRVCVVFCNLGGGGYLHVVVCRGLVVWASVF